MKSFLITLLIFASTMLNAQTITQAQAIQYAEKLYQVEILSEQGRDSLIHHVKNMTLQPDGMAILSGFKTKQSYKSNIKKSSILSFCKEAFASDYFFRTGFTDDGEKLQKEVFQTDDIQKLSKEEFEKLSEELGKRKAELEGNKIENLIPFEDTLPNGFSFSISMMNFPSGRNFTKSIHNKRSIVGKHRSRTLLDLLKIGLIDEKIYNKALPRIENNELYLETYLLLYLTRESEYFEDFEENKIEELQYVENLRNKKILSDDGYKKLLASYKPYEIKSKFEYLEFCNDALTFDLKKYSNNPQIYYPLIFNEIKKILPDFNFENLQIKLIENKAYSKDVIEQKATVIFLINGINYKNTFWHNYIKIGDEKENLPIVREDFHKGINKWLADINSPKRLYYANKSEGNIHGDMSTYYSDKTFGLILMDENQFKEWGENVTYFLSEQNHDNSFNTEGVKKIIKDFESIGLFKHLKKSEIDSAKMKVEEAEIVSYHDILLCFPKNIIYFDWESGNLENPYEELTSAFGAASRGAFTPINIEDTFQKSMDNNKPTCHFGFTFRGKRYKNDLQMNSDWLDPQFQELIEEAMLEQGVDGKIYNCMDGGQAAGYIFLNKVQHDFLTKNYPKFFPARD